jgi:hypothetical protein
MPVRTISGRINIGFYRYRAMAAVACIKTNQGDTNRIEIFSKREDAKCAKIGQKTLNNNFALFAPWRFNCRISLSTLTTQGPQKSFATRGIGLE